MLCPECNESERKKELNMKEIWKTNKGYEGIYQV